MTKLRNLLIIGVNVAGLLLVVFLLSLLKCPEILKWLVFMVLFIISFKNFIVTEEYIQKRSCWETSFLLFWKTQHFKLEIIKVKYIFGIIEYESKTIDTIYSLRRPPITEISQDLFESGKVFIPFFNSIIIKSLPRIVLPKLTSK